MPSPLFQFELRPLEQIQPWGEPEDPNLHWFGLTDGLYWIQAGGHRLFEYSDIAQARSGVPPFCDYQVVRLYEDVIDLAPHALEPVPEELQRYIALDESKPWNYYWSKWCESVDTSGASEDSMNILVEAGPWMGRRTLDSAYLAPSTNIVLWSNQDAVHIQWDNRDKLLQNCQAWSAQVGSWRLPRVKFMDEVRSFHERLMGQMEKRVSQVAAGALAKTVRVDLEGLRREQHTRSQSIERNLGQPAPPTDWPSVLAAVRSVEASEA
jgi:hypothetical protein